MHAFLMWIVQFILKYLFGLAKDEVRGMIAEKLSKKADVSNAEVAVEELRKPQDESKPVAEREKNEEDAFTRFRNRLRK